MMRVSESWLHMLSRYKHAKDALRIEHVYQAQFSPTNRLGVALCRRVFATTDY